jgi:hypothetical protein
MAAINLAATNINCGANLVDNNVVCEPDFIDYHRYLVQFINSFVNSTILSLGDTFTTNVSPGDIVNAKKQIFQLCSTGEMYPEFIQYMSTNATRVGFPPVLLSIFDVGMPGAPTLLTRVGPVEIKIVNLFVMGATMHLLGLKSWALDFDLKPTDGRPRLIDTIMLSFPINPQIVQAYVIRNLQLMMMEGAVQGPKDPITGVRHMPDAPVVRVAVDATSRGMKHIKNPMQELLLRVSNFLALGGGTGDIRTDVTRSHGTTLKYIANTLVQEPPNPFSHRLEPGTMIWNNIEQLRSTKLYLSTSQPDRHDVEMVLRPTYGMGHIRELYIFDTKNRQNCQHWRVINTNDGFPDNYVEYDVIFDPEGSSAWGAANGDECEVVVLRDGQIMPSQSVRISSQFHSFMGGGAKKQNKSKRRKQKRSNKKKSRHYNRNNRKRFY